jgi:signal transduction histidine kinase/CheY-like chemotaxis protein
MSALVEMSSQRRLALGERATIGRAAGSDVQIDDPMVSLAHAEVVRGADGSYQLRDLNSRRGTFVGAKRVTEAVLADGDEILIGPMRLRFEAAAHEAKPDASSLVGSEREELRRLRAVAELSRAIGVEHDLGRLLERVLETCFQLLRADRGTIMAYLPESKAPVATIARTRSGAPVADAISTTLLSQIMATHEPYLRTEVDHDLALQRSASLSAQGVRSLIAVPLLYRADETEWLGVIHLDSQASNNVFGPRDLELLGAIAGQAALAIKNAMLVRQVQTVRSADWRRLERVVANLPVGVVVLDDQRRCVLANDWVASRAELIGNVAAGTTIEAIATLPCERMIGSDRREQVTVGMPERTFTVAAHTQGDGGETVIVINEITEERAQQAKAAHQDRLALVGQLAGGIAHDFNNLLFVILNYAGMLEETAADEEVKCDLQTITQAARSAADLVRQLLTFSRREVVQPKVVDIAKLVSAMQSLLKRTVGPSIEVALDAATSVPHVLIDPSQVEQIVLNLVVNARDAMPEGGKVKIAVGTTGRFASLEVTDTGTGMSPEIARRVFEPYFTTKARGKGTGLGLATVHGIVQHAGGEITVDSELGQGTCFKVFLPQTDLSPDDAHATNHLHVARGRVLLVDDDEGVRRLTERMLRRAGYDVITASTGPDALSIARSEKLDLLLTDMVMPGMSGRDLARELMREHPETRVVFMSGYHQGTPIHGWQFIAKPFDRCALLAKIGEAFLPDLDDVRVAR